ncbi:MAG: hypothetical protein HC824_07340 [Synechococcales cyanobacterium RM1_1_8]|nr:hypothetical protein [Synechococcales cyanobacterium RM1_1_8]
MDVFASSGLGSSADRISGSTSLDSALQNAQHQLQLFFSSPNAAQQLDFVFDITNHQAAQTLLETDVFETFAFPQIQVLMMR